ncbi:MAG: hypothetical protein BM562_11255 [Alphaproteobacteria bacterium MedPE-SWcel]|nr:MAG: hypothetical protein BM562_11255 [Alphaproteobacteria bacterium MedPE-SWcel]
MEQQQGRVNWGMVLLIWAAGLGAAAQYGKISVVFDRLPELYPGVGASIGWAVSLVGVLGIVFGVVAGLFVSAFGYRRTLVCCLWLGAAMSALQVLHLPFGLFLLTRVIEGISHLGVVVAGPTLMALLATGAARGVALTIWSTFFGVSFAILSWVGLPLVASQGVLALFAAHGAVMALLAVILQVALRDLPVPGRTAYPRLGDLPALHLTIYRSPFKIAPGAGWLFYTCCFVSVLTVLPPFIPAEVRTLVMGAMPLVSIAVSMTLGVTMLRFMPAIRLIQIGFLLCTGAMVWLWIAPGDGVACLALAGAFGLVQGASFAAVPQLNHTSAAQSEANGVMSQAGNLGNAIGTPLMVAMISLGGYSGLAVVTGLLFLGGAGVHQILASRRAYEMATTD